MREIFKKIVQILTKNINKIIFYVFLLTITFYLSILFVNNFNLLKILIFVGVILLGFNLFLFIRLFKLPKEEKISLFLILQDILDSFYEGIVIYDENFKIHFVNKAFSQIVNLKKNDLINLTVNQSFFKNEKYEMLANVFFPLIQGQDLKIISEKPEIITVHFIQPRERYLFISYMEIFLEKPYKLRIVLDKTEDVIESQRRLEFVNLVSHNLLTPLNQIRWSLEAVDSSTLSESNKSYIALALNILKNTLIFAESILAFVRAESGKLELKIEEIDIEKILLQILDILREKINEKKLKVNVEIVEGEEKVFGDKGLLFAALFALVENAVVYNKIGGSIEIIVKKQEARPYRQIIIKDTGIGMSQEDLSNLFKKYYRGKKAKELNVAGFGIGIYNAKTILNLHGGDIKIESEENKGTNVSLLLPLDINLIPK